MSISSTIALRENNTVDLNWPGKVDQQNITEIQHTARMCESDRKVLDQQIDSACGRIAPLWPLKHFVAVNPFFGLSDKSFQNASDILARILGHGIYMSRDYYREQINSGRICKSDLKTAIKRSENPSLDINELESILNSPAPRANTGMAPVSKILEKVEGGLWSSFVTEQISRHCAAYFDMGQATISMPWRNDSLYTAWRKAAAIDMSPAMMGLGDFRSAVKRLPEDPREAIAWAIEHLDIPADAVERYLHASLLSIGGWAAWTRYLRWQAELNNMTDHAIVDLLAIRVMWDILLYEEKYSIALAAQWRDMLELSMRPPSAKRKAAAEIDRIMLNAMEIGFQRNIMDAIKGTLEHPSKNSSQTRPSVQAAFCIDVRSEVYRRSLETVSSGVQTLGFAGFFGIFIEYVPFAADTGHSHVPVLFNPSNRVHEEMKADEGTNKKTFSERRERLALSKMWKGFKFSASSAFSFVEATGLMYIPKLLSDSFGWTRPVPNPVTQGIKTSQAEMLSPVINPASTCCIDHKKSGIPEEEWLDHAERILRAMSMTDNFARLVMLTGHGSNTVNNPHATALDCGACAGQTGEASARVVVNILNDISVRAGLHDRGIIIPEGTWFIAGLHDTTTDNVTLFDLELVPDKLADDLKQLQQWLGQAAELTRMQRATLLGMDGQPNKTVSKNILRRANDWSQVRPEWALANNAAFIVAPRQRTRGRDLEGRAFLHEYSWQNDNEFKILELIMTAPMVVANWINMQYYGSVVDNETFGSGNKVLHNITGGAIGVIEGNGGDLRVGLPMQSIHDGVKWAHEPLRLSVFIEAPREAIDNIIEQHETVRQLVENKWLHLFQISEDGSTYRRELSGQWKIDT